MVVSEEEVDSSVEEVSSTFFAFTFNFNHFFLEVSSSAIGDAEI